MQGLAGRSEQAAFDRLPPVPDHVRDRLAKFISPAAGENYQVERALQAVRQGGLFGRGPGEGTVKTIIPDAHTDFMFAVIAEEYGEPLGETGRSHLQRIRRATQKMGTLIDNLLDLAQVSRQEIRHVRTDLSRIAEEAARELDESAPGRKVEWHIQPGLSAMGDPVLLKVALDNLLRNAWKFTARVPSPRIAFGCSEADGKTVYFVRDNGAGIDMAYADKLFQPFQRLHDPKEFEGTGIGLAIVHRVVRRHGGSIRVESAPGQGATFRVLLPNRELSA